MTSFEELIRVLLSGGVEFVIVGGVAGAAHGAARATYDLDVVYRRTPANMERLAKCLASHAPYLRGAPPGLPFRFDREAIQRGLNFTLDTDLGELDLLGEIAGAGFYEHIEPRSVVAEVFGSKCKCIDLPLLIKTKRAAGRPKDLEALAELEALLEETRKRKDASS